MARIFIDGFESGDMSQWDAIYNTSIAGPSLPGSGQYYLNMLSSGLVGRATKVIPDSAEYYVSFKYYTSEVLNGAYSAVCSFLGNGVQNINIKVVTGSICAYRYDTWVAGSPTYTIAASTWYLIEIYVKIADSGGRVVIKVNGATVADYTGDTLYSGSAIINSIRLGYWDSVAINAYCACAFDDIVIDNANWIGNTRIVGIVPTGVGATTGWTPSTGANWETVNELPASDTDYIKTSSSQTDTYQMGNITGATIASIKSVAVQTRNWRDGNGSYDRGQHIVRPASTDRLSASKTPIFPTISPKVFQSIWELNPEDSQAWEEADVNSMEVGIKAVTA